jgi:hypothetical protein
LRNAEKMKELEKLNKKNESGGVENTGEKEVYKSD